MAATAMLFDAGGGNRNANGANVSSLTLNLTGGFEGIYSVDSDGIILLSVFTGNTALSPARTHGTPTDDQGLVWSQVGSDVSYGATNGERHTLWKARVPNRGRLFNINVAFSGSATVASLMAIIIRGADIVSPQDVNANSLKTESHTASVASSVTGFSTTSADTVQIAFYASSTVGGDPGTLTGFTQVISAATSVRHKMMAKVATAVESSSTFTWSAATTTGSFIAIAIQPTLRQRLQMRLMDGFDQWASLAEMVQGAGSGKITWTTGGVGTAISFVTGRDGAGQAIRVQATNNDGRYASVQQASNSMDLTGLNTADTAATNFLDGEHWCCGFNVNLGSGTLGASLSGKQIILKYVGGTTTPRINLVFDPDTGTWYLTAGGTTPASYETNGTILDSNTPSYNPYQHWVYVEIHVFRHATLGYVEVWQEHVNAHAVNGSIINHYSGTVIPYYDSTQTGKNFKMVRVLSYTGDTSVATLGAINGINLYSGRAGTNNFMGNTFDDFWFGTGGGLVGEPLRIHAFGPTTDVATSGWSPSTGATHFGVVDEIIDSTADYVTASTGNPSDTLGGYAGPANTQKLVVAASGFAECRKTGGGTGKEVQAAVISNGKAVSEFSRVVANVLITSAGALCEYDPNTGSRWTNSGIQNLSTRFAVAGINVAGNAQSLDTEMRVYQDILLVMYSLAKANEENPVEVITTGANAGMEPIDVSGMMPRTAFHSIEIGISR